MGAIFHKLIHWCLFSYLNWQIIFKHIFSEWSRLNVFFVFKHISILQWRDDSNSANLVMDSVKMLRNSVANPRFSSLSCSFKTSSYLNFNCFFFFVCADTWSQSMWPFHNEMCRAIRCCSCTVLYRMTHSLSVVKQKKECSKFLKSLQKISVEYICTIYKSIEKTSTNILHKYFENFFVVKKRLSSIVLF